MFAKKSIEKVIRLALEKEKELNAMSLEDIEICVSSGNVKIGKTMNISTMPILCCGNCGECKKLCYDIKACLQYPNTVIDARMRNTVLLRRDRCEYFRRIEERISRRRINKFFRWHVAGDIIDVDYFNRMIEIAERHPDFVFWTYTKMYHVVNAWVDSHGGSVDAVPGNLHVMFSEWRGMPMHNPYSFPEFRVIFKGEEKPAGFYCPGNCDICKASHRGCIAGELTYCDEH